MSEQFLNDHIKNIMNELYYYLKKQGANPETAKDIVQDAVYKFMIHIESIDTDKYKAWIFKVAINLYYDYCRKNKQSLHQQLDENLFGNLRMIEDILVRKEDEHRIKETLKRLPNKFKQLLLLKYDLEWPYQQIAEYMDMKPEGVKTYLFRARAKFKELYGEEKHEE